MSVQRRQSEGWLPCLDAIRTHQSKESQLYFTPLQINEDPEVIVDVGIHESIINMLGRPEIATDVIAPLLHFDHRHLRNAKQVTYGVARPFEYFPFLEIVYHGGHTIFWTHGAYSGWETVGERSEIFAGSRPPQEGEKGTLHILGKKDAEVQITRNLREMLQEVLGG